MKPDRELERLKGLLMRSESFSHTFNLVRRIVGIFIDHDDREAEKVLADLLDCGNEGIQFLALCALWDAENRGKLLDWKTQVKLSQFRNNPINERLCDMVSHSLKAEKAPFN